jgi:hypothetical protein
MDDLDFDIIPAIPPTPRQVSTTWVTPGMDGFGALQDGSRAEEFTFSTVFYADSSEDANDHGTAAIALESTALTLTNDWGDDFENVFVIEVNTDGFKKPCNHKGNANAVRCQIFWRCRVSH